MAKNKFKVTHVHFNNPAFLPAGLGSAVTLEAVKHRVEMYLDGDLHCTYQNKGKTYKFAIGHSNLKDYWYEDEASS